MSDDRVERSLYQLAIGWNGNPPNTTAAIFWLKNRRPDRWRDVQQLQSELGVYILSDKPLSEQEWIEQRTIVEQKTIREIVERIVPWPRGGIGNVIRYKQISY